MASKDGTILKPTAEHTTGLHIGSDATDVLGGVPHAPDVLVATNGHTPVRTWKIPPRRIRCDDCVVYVGRQIQDGKIIQVGEPYAVHAGEEVDIIPISSLQAYASLGYFHLEGRTDEERMERLAKLDGALDNICAELANRVVWWNWTGFDNVALPQPYRQPAVIKSLQLEEIFYLLDQTGETRSDRKNAGSGSPAISSAPDRSRPS